MKKELYKARSIERGILHFKWESNQIKLPRNPEFYLLTSGCLGYIPDRDLWVTGQWNGLRDEYGEYTTFVGRSLATTPITGEWKNHDEIIVCGNTSNYRPYSLEYDWYSYMKEQADESIETQLIGSRLSKAFIAENDQQKKQIEMALKAIKKGLPAVIVTSLLQSLDTVDLTDPSQIEKMQYLSSFYQTLEKRESNFNGLDLEILDKKAQVNTEEIRQYDDVTTIDYLIQYEARLEFVKEMEEKGIEIKIVPNPVFWDEPTKEDIEEGTFEAAEPAEPEPEELQPEQSEEVKEEEADGNKDD